MSISVTCKCGKKLLASDDAAGKRVKCPACGVPVVIPASTAVAGVAESPFQGVGDLLDELMTTPAAAPLAAGQIVCQGCGTVLPADVSACRNCGLPTPAQQALAQQRRQQGQALKRQATHLRLAGMGLMVHYAGMGLLLAALWASFIALGFVALAFLPGFGATLLPVVPLLMTAGVLLIASAACEVPAAALCFCVPDMAARVLLTASLACRLAAPILAVTAMVSHGELAAWLTLSLSILAWVLWMLFLRQTARIVGDNDLGDQAFSLLAQGLLTAALAIGLLFGLIWFQGFVMEIKAAWLRIVVIGFALGVLMSVVRIALTMESIESPIKTLLYPTSIPFVMAYMDFVGTLRNTIVVKPGRRSA